MSLRKRIWVTSLLDFLARRDHLKWCSPLLAFALFSLIQTFYKTYNKPHIMPSGTFLGWKGLLAFAVGGELARFLLLHYYLLASALKQDT